MRSVVYGQSFVATEKYLRFNEEGKLGEIGICKTLSKILKEYFVENECFCQREMEMSRDLIATIYNTGMEPLAMIANELGV